MFTPALCTSQTLFASSPLFDLLTRANRQPTLTDDKAEGHRVEWVSGGRVQEAEGGKVRLCVGNPLALERQQAIMTS